MDGGDTVEPPLLAELLSSDRTLLLQTTPLNRRAPPGDSTGAWSRGMLTLRLMLTTATVELTLATVMVDTATTDKSAKGWCRELQPMKICSISKLGTENKTCSLEIRYFLMCIFMGSKNKM